MAIRCSNLVESKSENGLLFAFTMWLVDVYNYDKEIKLIFIFWFDIVMQFFYIKNIRGYNEE